MRPSSAAAVVTHRYGVPDSLACHDRSHEGEGALHPLSHDLFVRIRSANVISQLLFPSPRVCQPDFHCHRQMQITFIDNEKKAAGALGALLDLKNVEKCVLRLLLRVEVCGIAPLSKRPFAFLHVSSPHKRRPIPPCRLDEMHSGEVSSGCCGVLQEQIICVVA